MSNFETEIPVLVIEDNDDHWKQIQKELSKGPYISHRLINGDQLKMQNYLALYPHTQIIIVDLELDGIADKGWKIIDNHLWPSNRTAFFIVFSKHKDEETTIRANKPQANRTFLWKGEGDGPIEDHILNKLKSLVDECYRISSPELPLPFYDEYEIAYNFYSSSTFQPSDRGKIEKAYFDPICLSVDRLNDCIDIARFFDRAGMLSKNIGIGVFGSCGRMESHRNSDIEIVVFFDPKSDTDDEVFDFACRFWNRMRFALEGRGYSFEGKSWVETEPSKLLNPKTVYDRTDDFQMIANQLIPVVNIEMFERGKKKCLDQLRNKAFQVLTEMRPIFNPDFIDEMKLTVLQKLCNKDLPDPDVLIQSSTNFSAIFRQFELSTEEEGIENSVQLKRYVFRTLHILSSQLEMIRLLIYETEFTNELLIERLLVPPLGKLLDFLDTITREDGGQLEEPLKSLIQNQARLVVFLHKYLDNTEADWGAYVREHVSNLHKEYQSVFNEIDRVTKIRERAPWLFEVPPLNY